MIVCIHPSTFTILPLQQHQNPYIKNTGGIDLPKAKRQHKHLVEAFRSSGAAVVNYRLGKTDVPLPDITFVANGGMKLPRLPYVLLPSMKYPQRKAELPFLIDMYREIGVATLPFPTRDVFEGNAEMRWFLGGTLAVCGTGYRCTKKTCGIMREFFNQVYHHFNLKPPIILNVPIISPKFYHLDIAMLAVDDATCIVHDAAVSKTSIRALRAAGLTVHVIETTDLFCLNAVVSNGFLITHKLIPESRAILKGLITQKIIEVDVSEFEKSGGSVNCLTLKV